MIPASDLKLPLDSVWLFHAAGGQFTKLLDRFNTALSTRYGAPTSIEDYTFTAQLMTYENERAMFEAYRRNAYVSTGIIQWMFNNAWPSIYWHLFDWYLRPAGGYFGTKKANEPVHAIYSYDDRSIAIVNGNKSRTPVRRAHLKARMFGVDGALKFTRDTIVDIPADSSMRVFTLPQPTCLSAGASGNSAYFVDLRLTSAQGQSISRNFYWLSTKPDVLSDSSTWYMTPTSSYADFTQLRNMPRATVKSSAAFSSVGGSGYARVTLTNTGSNIAFFIRLQVTGRDGEEALPVTWDDNYVSLLPGETRVLTASYRISELGGGPPKLKYGGWNVSASGLTRRATPAMPPAPATDRDPSAFQSHASHLSTQKVQAH
jgi:exo-1,4-beta-D-glucosaminidase